MFGTALFVAQASSLPAPCSAGAAICCADLSQVSQPASRPNRFAILALCLSALALPAATVTEDAAGIRIVAPNYQIEIQKAGFCYGLTTSAGVVIAPPHAQSGLEFSGAPAVSTKLIRKNSQSVSLEVANQNGQTAKVAIELGEHWARFSVKAPASGRIIARTGGISPVFGLADNAAKPWFKKSDLFNTTEVTGFDTLAMRNR